MEDLKTTVANEPLLMWCDNVAIDRHNKTVKDGLESAQQILNAYNEYLPHVPPLTTGTFQSIFHSGLPEFIEGLRWHWYDNNFADAHKGFGISRAKGFTLVNDQVPDFSPFAEAVNNAHQQLGDILAFEIVNDEIKVNQRYVDQVQENSHKFYLTYPNEFKVKEVLTTMAKCFETIRELVPGNVLQLDESGGPLARMDYSQLENVFEVFYPRFGETKWPEMKVRLNFYRALKATLIRDRRTGN